MCFRDTPPGRHVCCEHCPVCFKFTVANIRRLAEGEHVELGIAEEFGEAAHQGCVLCYYIGLKLGSGPYQPTNAYTGVSMAAVKGDDGKPVLPMTAISFGFHWSKVTDTRGSFGGDGEVSVKGGWYAFSVGIVALADEVQEHVTRELANPSVSSEDALRYVTGLLDDCKLHHKACPDYESTLPSRVLDLRALGVGKGDGDTVKLYLGHGEEAQYVALSYRWGNAAEQMTLNRSNLAMLTTHGCRVDQLPKTIQDAIYVTRKLGIPYLWVDSLCIVQDSEEDLLTEIGDMANIYKKATLTISAASAIHRNQGFLEDRAVVSERTTAFAAPFLMSDTSLENLERARQTEDAKFVNVEEPEVKGRVFLFCDPNLGFHVKQFHEELINTRAWTLQEAWLSPRLLVFGSGSLKWSCVSYPRLRTWSRDVTVDGRVEADPRTGFGERVDIRPPSFFIGRQEILKKQVEFAAQKGAVSLQPDEYDLIGRCWKETLQQYSERQLSCPTDRPLAIAALAAEYHTVLRDEYLAGLWRRSLPNSLLWRRIKDTVPGETGTLETRVNLFRERMLRRSKRPTFNDEHVATESEQKIFIAPSWSPLSVSVPLIFDRPRQRFWCSWAPSRPRVSLLTIHSTDVKLDSELMPFGQVLHGRIDLTGPMCSFGWRELCEKFIFQKFDVINDIHIERDVVTFDDETLQQRMSERYGEVLNAQDIFQLDSFGQVDEYRWWEDSVVAEQYQEPPPRPIPPAARIPFPEPKSEDDGAQGQHARQEHSSDDTPNEYDKVDPSEFWLLEFTHTHIPRGLVLFREYANVFRRVGFFRMGRAESHDTNFINGIQVSGPRAWDLDQRMEMRRITLI